MEKKIMNFNEFWWYILSLDNDFYEIIIDINQQIERLEKLDALCQNFDLQLDEKHKAVDKKAVKLDKPTKNHLDRLIADYERSKLKREYLAKRIKTTNTGGGGFTA